MDITIEEEASLPLPNNWIRVHKHDGTTFYKSTVTVVETDEHPYIVQALNAARKCVLPQGWIINETTNSGGGNDYYYCNPSLGLSMWDPPSLRSCLADCLRGAGFKVAAERIMSQISAGVLPKEANQVDILETPASVPLANDISVTYQQFRLQQQMLAGQNDAVAAQQAQIQRSKTLQQHQNQQWISLRPEDQKYGSGPISLQPLKQTAEDAQVAIDITRAAGAATTTVTPPPPLPVLADDDEQPVVQSQEEEPSATKPKVTMPIYVERDVNKPTLDEMTQDGTSAPINLENLRMVEENDKDDNDEFDDDDYSSSESSSDESTDSEEVDRQHVELAATQADKMISPESEIVFHTAEIRDTIAPYFKADKWGWSELAIQRLSSEIAELEAAYAPVTYRIQKSKPPITSAGIRLLVDDVCSTNERMHQLLLLLRSKLNARNNIRCRTIHTKAKFLNDIQEQLNSSHSNPRNQKDLDYVALADQLCIGAGEIIHVLREYPAYCVEVISYFSQDQANLSLVSYLLLNRLLHPFSCDSSLTTALLLEGINMQMTEMGHIEQIFPDLDGHALMSRALFIRNPQVALCWNPLAQPLPVAPMVPYDTTLTCLLKAYAIRRDITAYFRLIWKPMFPSILVLGSKGDSKSTPGQEHHAGTTADTAVSSSTVLADIFSVATRLLELSLKTAVVTAFPPGASAVCRAIYMIAGIEAVQIYILSFLLIPNLVKVLLYENDSVDNEEDIYFSSRHRGKKNKNTTSDVSMNKFFNLNVWWPSEGYTTTNFKPVHALIWQVWRIYTGAAFLNNVTITVMTSDKFFGNGPPMSARDIPEQRLRNILFRLKAQINRAVEILIKVPLDVRANEILGIEPFKMSPEEAAKATAPSSNFTIEGIPAKYWIKRMESLVVKPAHMNQLGLFSRHELSSLLGYIKEAMEVKAKTNKMLIAQGREVPPLPPGVPSTSSDDSPLYEAILDFLAVDEVFNAGNGGADGSDADDELITIPLQNDGQLATEEKRDAMFERFFGTSETSNSGNEAAAAKGAKPTRRGSSAGVAQVSTENMAMADYETMKNQRLFRYDQLCRGLKLLERYEDSVVVMLKKIESGGVCTMKTLVEDSSWAAAVDFDVDVKIEQFNTVVRHTKGSGQKTKSSHYGLRLARATNSLQLQQDHSNEFQQVTVTGGVGEGKNHVSRSNLEKDFFSSLRFGTAAVAANAGTTMARLTKSPPPRQTKNRNYHPSARANSANPFDPYITDKQFMKPTEVIIMKHYVKPVEAETRHQREQEFANSLRSPTKSEVNAFFGESRNGSTRRGMRSRNSSFNTLPSASTANGGSQIGRRQSALASVVQQRAAPLALPFPEHMKHRLRQQPSGDVLLTPEEEVTEGGNGQYDDVRYDEYGNELIDGEYFEDCGPDSDGEGEDSNCDDNQSVLDEAKSILNDYQSIKRGHRNGVDDYNREVWQATSTVDRNKNDNITRSTSSGHYAAPTESALKRLAATRTVYDSTGAGMPGMPLRGLDHHVDHVVPHHYEFDHHEMPHGHPHNHNYSNHPNSAEHQDENDGAPVFHADSHHAVDVSHHSYGDKDSDEEADYGHNNRFQYSHRGRNFDSRRTAGQNQNSRSISPGSRSQSRSRSNSRGRSGRTPPALGFGSTARGRMGVHSDEGSYTARSTPSGHYAAPTVSTLKRLTTTRTVYDNTGAGMPGMPLRGLNHRVDNEFEHQEIPRGHSQNLDYANHTNSAEYQYEDGTAAAARTKGYSVHDDDHEEFFEPAKHLDSPLHHPVPSRAPVNTVSVASVRPLAGLSGSSCLHSSSYPVRVVAPLTRTMHVDVDDVMPDLPPQPEQAQQQSDLPSLLPTQEHIRSMNDAVDAGDAHGDADVDADADADAGFDEQVKLTDSESFNAAAQLIRDRKPIEEQTADWQDNRNDAGNVGVNFEPMDDGSDHSNQSDSVKALADTPMERNAYDEDVAPVHAQSPKGPRTITRQHTWNSMALAEQLLVGVKAIKHGKSGSPKEKIFKYVPELRQLQWSNVKQTIASMFRMGSSKDPGSDAVSGSVDPSLGMVDISDFREVKRGIHTEVSLKARATNKALDPLCFLSIVAVNRTIDIQCASSKDRDLFVRSLQGIVNTNKLSVHFS